MRRAICAILTLMIVQLILCGCMDRVDEGLTWRLNSDDKNVPPLPEKLEIGGEGLPVLKVYDVK